MNAPSIPTTNTPNLHVVGRNPADSLPFADKIQPKRLPIHPARPNVIPDHVTVSVVIPAMNEEKNLPHLLPLIPDWVHEILLVDGNSTDRTIEVAQEICPRIRIVMQEGRGKGAALRMGFRSAKGNIIVMLDADGSMDPREIPSFVGALLAGADVVKGSRFVQGGGTTDMPFYRKVGNWALTTAANVLFKTSYTDITYGYNAAWNYTAPSLALEIDGWSHEIVNILRAARHGMKVVEVACFEHSRIAGVAKLHAFSAGWTILKQMVKERFGTGRNWRIWERRTVVGDTVLTPALQVLRVELLALLNSEKYLTPAERQSAIKSLEMAFTAVLEMETDHPDVKILQRQYQEEYARNGFEGFMKSLQPAAALETKTAEVTRIPARVVAEDATAPARPAALTSRIVAEDETAPARPAGLQARMMLEDETAPARPAGLLRQAAPKAVSNKVSRTLESVVAHMQMMAR
jgi:hypothetical protein